MVGRVCATRVYATATLGGLETSASVSCAQARALAMVTASRAGYANVAPAGATPTARNVDACSIVVGTQLMGRVTACASTAPARVQMAGRDPDAAIWLALACMASCAVGTGLAMGQRGLAFATQAGQEMAAPSRSAVCIAVSMGASAWESDAIARCEMGRIRTHAATALET